MKKLSLLTLVVLILTGCANHRLVVMFGPGCRRNSWNPEAHAYYGTKDSIVEKLAKVPGNLSDHRVFLQITYLNANAGDSGEVKLFEQKSGTTFAVTQWSAKKTTNLIRDIDKEMLTNIGNCCVGEETKTLLQRKLGAGTPRPDVDVTNPQEALKDSVNKTTGNTQTILIVLC